jgi:hypothetical protein
MIINDKRTAEGKEQLIKYVLNGITQRKICKSCIAREQAGEVNNKNATNL